MTAAILVVVLLSVGPEGVPVPQTATRAATTVPAQESTVLALPVHSLRGIATWYRYRLGEAAAGPALRRALGVHWRGRRVRVNGYLVRLSDWCACPGGRIVDLDSRTFRRIAPLWRGVVRVTVTW